MSIIIKSGASTNVANVNTDGELATSATMYGNDGTTNHKLRAGVNGDLAVSLTNPTTAGVYAGISPFGTLNVSVDPTVLIFESGDTGLDTTNKWTAPGTVTPTVVNSNILINAGTAASASAVLTSMPTFQTATAVTFGAKIAVEASPIATGNHRFFGLGTSPTTPGTAAAPLQDAIGFEIDTTGALHACAYANGVRIYSQTITLPTDGQPHLYAFTTRADVTYFYLDSFATPIASTYLGPAVQTLPLRLSSLNGTSATVNTPTFTATGVVLYDVSRQGNQIADGTFPWRRAQVGRAGGLSIKGANYTPVSTAFAAAATGNTPSIDVSEAGNVTFTIKNTVSATAYTGAPVIVLEQSDDNVNWAPLLGTRSDTDTVTSTITPTGAAATSTVVDCAVESISYVRARVTTGTTTGGMTIVVQPGGMAFTPLTAVIQPVRTSIAISGVNLAVGATGVETLLTLSRSANLATATSNTSFPVTFGKRFRMTSLLVSQVGNVTIATNAVTTFKFRVNTTGAVTTSSNTVLQARLATLAQTGHYQNIALPLPDGWEMPGDGIGQFGVSVNSVYSVNPPTVDVMLTGYEY